MKSKESFFHKMLRSFYGINQLDERREQELNRINSHVFLLVWSYTLLANFFFLVILSESPKVAAWVMISSNLIIFGLVIPLYTARQATQLQLITEELDKEEARKQRKKNRTRILLGIGLWAAITLFFFPLAVWWVIGGELIPLMLDPLNLLVWTVIGLGFGLAVWHVVRRNIQPIDNPDKP